jgi:predicted nucleic-acid-binding protein
MISLDTNVVLRFLLGDVADQTQKATELIESNTVYVTDVIVVEIVYVLEKVYELSRKDICDLLTDFLNFNNVVHNPRFLLKTINLYKNHPALSIVDCQAPVFCNTLSKLFSCPFWWFGCSLSRAA